MTAPRAPKPGSLLEATLRALRRHNGLTVASAFELGNCHLSASVYRLKRAGWRIVDRWETGITRYGANAKFKRFRVPVSQPK